MKASRLLQEDASAPLKRINESYEKVHEKQMSILNKFREQYCSVNKKIDPEFLSEAQKDVLTCLTHMTEHISMSAMRLQMASKTQHLQAKEVASHMNFLSHVNMNRILTFQVF